MIRKRINLEAEKAIFIFINNKIPPTGVMLYHIMTRVIRAIMVIRIIIRFFDSLYNIYI